MLGGSVVVDLVSYPRPIGEVNRDEDASKKHPLSLDLAMRQGKVTLKMACYSRTSRMGKANF
jgi:hypothetical protein